MKDNKVLLELARKTISAVSSVDAEFVETAPIGIVDFEKWEWTQGVGLFALWQYYKLSGDVSVRKKIEKWYSDRLCEGLPEKNVNTMCPLLTMLFLYEETGGEEFLPVLHEWAEYAMHSLPRTCEGGIQHSCTGSPNPGQIWDDTLYMTVLFLAKYGVLFGRDDCLEESVYQFLVHIKYLTHRRSGFGTTAGLSGAAITLRARCGRAAIPGSRQASPHFSRSPARRARRAASSPRHTSTRRNRCALCKMPPASGTRF